MEKLVVYEKLFFDKLFIIIPSAKELNNGQKKTLFFSSSLCSFGLIYYLMYYILTYYPGILSLCFSTHNIHLTITSSNDDKLCPKIILSWLLFGIFENMRIILDRMPITRLTAHLGTIYIINISCETNKKILLELSNKSKEVINNIISNVVETDSLYSEPQLNEHADKCSKSDSQSMVSQLKE